MTLIKASPGNSLIQRGWYKMCKTHFSWMHSVVQLTKYPLPCSIKSSSLSLQMRCNIVLLPVEAAEGRMAHNNVWNGVNGMASNTWKPCIWCHSTDSAPIITTIPFSPIKVPPTSCAFYLSIAGRLEALIMERWLCTESSWCTDVWFCIVKGTSKYLAVWIYVAKEVF